MTDEESARLNQVAEWMGFVDYETMVGMFKAQGVHLVLEAEEENRKLESLTRRTEVRRLNEKLFLLNKESTKQQAHVRELEIANAHLMRDLGRTEAPPVLPELKELAKLKEQLQQALNALQDVRFDMDHRVTTARSILVKAKLTTT